MTLWSGEQMSRYGLHRTGSASYRQYLKSQQRGFRRVRRFRDCRAKGYEPACQVCGITLAEVDSLDLHHVSYAGVTWDDSAQRWSAQESHEDLMPMCRNHHEQLHRIMDGRKEFYGWGRRRATVVVIARLIQRQQYLEHHFPKGQHDAR